MDDVQRTTEPGPSTVTEPETPLWTKLVATTVGILLIVAIIVFRHRIGADFWPLDSSRVGPNIVASILTWAAIFTATALLYPPWRRRLHRFIDKKFIHHLQPVHEKLDIHAESLQGLHDKHDQLLASHTEIHRKLDALGPTPAPNNPQPRDSTGRFAKRDE